jgi:hypothetical protein
MELLISFLLALGIITSGTQNTLTSSDVQKLTQENHELLVQTYGKEYLNIIGTDQTEKD